MMCKMDRKAVIAPKVSPNRNTTQCLVLTECLLRLLGGGRHHKQGSWATRSAAAASVVENVEDIVTVFHGNEARHASKFDEGKYTPEMHF